jgi:hypothetical protein
MSSHTRDNEKSTHLSEEEKKLVMGRCFRMVDYLCDIVSDYIQDFVQDVPCLTANRKSLSTCLSGFTVLLGSYVAGLMRLLVAISFLFL